MRMWLMMLGALLLCGCAAEPVPDDLPGPPTAFDAGRFDAMEAGLFKSYLQLQDALAHDEFDAATGAATSLVSHAGVDLAAAARTVADAQDMSTMRQAFRPLSEALIETDLPEGIEVAYCPMAFNYEGGRWLQQQGDISNPYYGASMLRCGAFEESTKPGQDKD